MVAQRFGAGPSTEGWSERSREKIGRHVMHMRALCFAVVYLRRGLGHESARADRQRGEWREREGREWLGSGPGSRPRVTVRGGRRWCVVRSGAWWCVERELTMRKK